MAPSNNGHSLKVSNNKRLMAAESPGICGDAQQPFEFTEDTPELELLVCHAPDGQPTNSKESMKLCEGI